MKSTFVALIWFRDAKDKNLAKLWEERLVLIEGIDEVDAKAKAEQFGKAAEHSYVSATGKDVDWTFDEVHDVRFVEGKLEDGQEVYSRFLRSSEIDSLKRPFDEIIPE